MCPWHRKSIPTVLIGIFWRIVSNSIQNIIFNACFARRGPGVKQPHPETKYPRTLYESQDTPLRPLITHAGDILLSLIFRVICTTVLERVANLGLHTPQGRCDLSTLWVEARRRHAVQLAKPYKHNLVACRSTEPHAQRESTADSNRERWDERIVLGHGQRPEGGHLLASKTQNTIATSCHHTFHVYPLRHAPTQGGEPYSRK